MQDFLGITGNQYYIYNLDNNEGCIFDSFGKAVEFCNGRYASIVSKGKTSVDIISFLGKANQTFCEVYYQGHTAIVNYNYMNAYKMLSKKEDIWASFMIFRVSRKEDFGLNQLIRPLKKGGLSIRELSTILNIKKWES